MEERGSERTDVVAQGGHASQDLSSWVESALSLNSCVFVRLWTVR